MPSGVCRTIETIDKAIRVYLNKKVFYLTSSISATLYLQTAGGKYVSLSIPIMKSLVTIGGYWWLLGWLFD